MDYLNDIEKTEIQKFLDNKTMANAVKKVLLEAIYNQGTIEPGKPADTKRNFMLRCVLEGKTTEEVGQSAKAVFEGLTWLEAGFRELEKYNWVEQEKKQKLNIAR